MTCSEIWPICGRMVPSWATRTSNAGNPTVTASGTGVIPVLSVTPTTLSFGNQTIGTTSAAQTVTISNTGGATLTVSSLTSSDGEFAFSPASVAPIAAGGSATLSVTFAPTSPAGAKSSTISIVSNGGNASVSATGTAVVPAGLSVLPATLTFGNQTVGTTSAAQTVTIANTGGTVLTVNSITNSNTADFVLTAPATPFTVSGGASQTFTVAFKPGSAGAKSATVSVASTAGNASVSASGAGVLGSPPPSDFSIWAGKWFSVDITQGDRERIRRSTGYVQILSWKPDDRVFKARIYRKRSKYEDLTLIYTSGTPFDFLCRFEYADAKLTGRIIGKTDASGSLSSATLDAASDPKEEHWAIFKGVMIAAPTLSGGSGTDE